MKQTLKFIYEILVENLKIAESKYAITIALASAVIVFGASFLTKDFLAVNIFAGCCMIFSLISMLYAFVALFARNVKIKKKIIRKHYTNLMYFKTIIKFDEESYVKEIKKRYNFPKTYKPDEQDFDLAREIIALAKVSSLKFLYFNLSLFFLMLSVIFAVGIVLFVGGI